MPDLETWNYARAQGYREARQKIGSWTGQRDEDKFDRQQAKDPKAADPNAVMSGGVTRAAYDQHAGEVTQRVGDIKARQEATDTHRKAAFKTRFKVLAVELGKSIVYAGKEVDPLLRELGGYIAYEAKAKFIPGPIKTAVSGFRKSSGPDYGGNWSKNKDLARCTVACESQPELTRVVQVIRAICTPRYGIQLIKIVEVKPGIEGNDCGYSGWNFAVVFKGLTLPAEIQANTYAMMYGKMAKQDYTDAILGGDESQYVRAAGTMGFPGSLGHLFYEIWREDKGGPDGTAAAALGCWYSDLCRMAKPQRDAAAGDCRRRYAAFCAALVTDKAKNLVAKHPI
jgi:hypothetical protein